MEWVAEVNASEASIARMSAPMLPSSGRRSSRSFAVHKHWNNKNQFQSVWIALTFRILPYEKVWDLCFVRIQTALGCQGSVIKWHLFCQIILVIMSVFLSVIFPIISHAQNPAIKEPTPPPLHQSKHMRVFIELLNYYYLFMWMCEFCKQADYISAIAASGVN